MAFIISNFINWNPFVIDSVKILENRLMGHSSHGEIISRIRSSSWPKQSSGTLTRFVNNYSSSKSVAGFEITILARLFSTFHATSYQFHSFSTNFFRNFVFSSCNSNIHQTVTVPAYDPHKDIILPGRIGGQDAHILYKNGWPLMERQYLGGFVRFFFFYSTRSDETRILFEK